MDSMRQSACLVVDPIMVNNVGFLFNHARIKKQKVDHHLPVSEMSLKWLFAGGLMMAQH